MDYNVLRRIIILGCSALGIRVISASALTAVLVLGVQKQCAVLKVIYEIIFDSQKPFQNTFNWYETNTEQTAYLHFDCPWF